MKVKELFKIRKGKKANQEVETFQDGAVRYIQIEDLRNNDNIKYCIKDDDVILANENDIIIAWDGANAATSNYSLKGAIGSTLGRLRPKKDNFYLPYVGLFIKSKQRYLRDNCTGATIPHVDRKVLQNLDVPLPDYEIQKKIADVIEKTDNLRLKRRQTIDKLDELTQSVFLDMFGDPNLNPKSWNEVQLKEIGKLKSGGTPSRSNEEYFSGETNWFTAGELNEMFIADSNEKITDDALENSSAKLFDAGSLLIGMYDTAAFKLSIVEKISSANQACAGITLDEDRCLVEWLYFNLKLMRDNVLHHRRGIRQKNLNLGFIKDFSIPLPPLEDQIDFRDKQQEIWDLKIQGIKQLSELDNLFKSLLQKAFKGELNFRDNDEPLLAAKKNEEYVA